MPKIYDENGIATEIDDSIYYSLDDLPGEEWKDIFYFDEKKGVWVDFRGKYQISNKGRVKSLLRRASNGRVFPEKIISPNMGAVILANENITKTTIQISIRNFIHFMFDLNGYEIVGRKRVVCLTTGMIYKSLNDAERRTGVNASTISVCCRRNSPYAGRLVDGKTVQGHKYRNQGIPLIWRYMEDVIYEG